MNWVNQTNVLQPPGAHMRSSVAATTFPQGILFIGGHTISPPSGGSLGRAGDSYYFTSATGWQKVQSPTVPDQLGRTDTAIAYDAKNARFIVFSGLGESGTLPGSTWALTSATTASAAWTQILPAGGGNPTQRYAHAMTYHPGRESVIMVGGFAGTYGSSTFAAEAWELRNGAWSPICGSPPAGGCPFSGRAYLGLTYDALRAVIVMFGGQFGVGTQSLGLSGETWELDLATTPTWTNRTPVDVTKSPAGRSRVGLAYHPGRQTVIAHGGSSDGSNPRSDTWEWNGTCWTQLPGTPPPAYNYRTGFAYSPGHGGVVAIGGTLSDNTTPVPDVSYGQ
ncbi:MAG: hypothetical protein KIT84_22420 [Labilithrix sp.]|nr:hypothetical protein [Labilithrix sp.]MCW5813800.1 hypothetical protein [Labilithrix sp.]